MTVIADPNPMWRKEPWVEHGQAEGKRCIGTQTSTPEHFHSALFIFWPRVGTLLRLLHFSQTDHLQVKSLPPSSLALSASRLATMGKITSKKVTMEMITTKKSLVTIFSMPEPPLIFYYRTLCHRLFTTIGSHAAKSTKSCLPLFKTAQLQMDNLVLKLAICPLWLSAPLTNLQLHPNITFLH